MELKDDTDDILDHKMKLMYAKIKELSKMEKSIIFLYLEEKIIQKSLASLVSLHQM